MPISYVKITNHTGLVRDTEATIDGVRIPSIKRIIIHEMSTETALVRATIELVKVELDMDNVEVVDER